MKANAVTLRLLEIDQLTVGYALLPVLENVHLTVCQHRIVAVVGPNGAGKTTLLKAVSGLIRPVRGYIRFAGEAIEAMSVQDIVRRGIVYVPEGMKVFPQMTVLENLEIGGYLNRSRIRAGLEMVMDLFPELRDRLRDQAGILSGGQQRMVTLGRGLMADARLLLLDDPFLGLSPKFVKRFCSAFRTLRQSGVTLFIAGQHVRRILNVADAAFLLEDGTVTLAGSGPGVLHSEYLQQILFGVRPKDQAPSPS
jgi:branched-chain amino acid transport system ATP-binding protein